MSLQERVARGMYEHQRGKGWDDAIDTVRDVYLEQATAALMATVCWLESVSQITRRPALANAVNGIARFMRKAADLPAREALSREAVPDDPHGLREVLEGFM